MVATTKNPEQHFYDIAKSNLATNEMVALTAIGVSTNEKFRAKYGMNQDPPGDAAVLPIMC